MTDSPCPSRDELENYLLGKLSDEAADRVVEHVNLCTKCQAVLPRLVVSEDKLVSRLKAPEVDDFYGRETACQNALQAILNQVYQATQLREASVTKIDPETAWNSQSGESSVSDHESEAAAEASPISDIDLATLVHRHGPLPIADACELVRLAALALAAAHQFGLARLEVHPGNLVLTTTGEVKVLDLGLELASGASEDQELTSAGAVLGLLDYMAPEQTGDSRQVDVRADVYRLGATLYKLLTGRAPFDNPRYNSPVKKMLALVSESPPLLSEHRPDAPDGLILLVARMLAKAPGERFAAPADVASALAPFVLGTDVSRLIRLWNKGPEEFA